MIWESPVPSHQSSIKLLGTLNDAELSRRLRRGYHDIRNQRLLLHIQPFQPKAKWKHWTRAEEKLLGTIADEDVAQRLKRSLGSVKAHRFFLGVLKPDSRYRPWEKSEEALLGKVPDREIAAQLGRPRHTLAEL